MADGNGKAAGQEVIGMDDGAIVELVRSGNRDEAARQLLLQFRRKVFSLIFSILRDRAHAEDISQEVFIKVWQKLPGFDRRASLATWLFHIARNAAISALRTRKSQAQLNQQLENELCAQGTDVPGSDDITCEAAGIVRLIDTLPDAQRRVVILFYMQERSYQDVADLLDMPLGTVKTLLHRARAQLAAAAALPPEDVAV
jgi:RNA polymerase sigma-70 factor (ECF subfamily)